MQESLAIVHLFSFLYYYSQIPAKSWINTELYEASLYFKAVKAVYE